MHRLKRPTSGRSHRQYTFRNRFRIQSGNLNVSGVGPVDMSDALSLQNIRSSLIRQEDTIIFSFIERAQFSRNDAVYISSDAIPIPGKLVGVSAW